MLLDLASLIFEEQQCLEVLLRKIAGTILSFMQAQACTIFIADDDSMVSTHTHARYLFFKDLIRNYYISFQKERFEVFHKIDVKLLSQNMIIKKMLCRGAKYTQTMC